MNATLLYRIAAVVPLLFAAGHTFGFLGFKPSSPEGVAVRDAMNNLAFQFKGSSYTYGNFCKGFGLTITAYLLFSAFLAWHLGSLASSQPQGIGMLGWAFAATQRWRRGLTTACGGRRQSSVLMPRSGRTLIPSKGHADSHR